jgi:hypothetical protein
MTDKFSYTNVSLKNLVVLGQRNDVLVYFSFSHVERVRNCISLKVFDGDFEESTSSGFWSFSAFPLIAAAWLVVGICGGRGGDWSRSNRR